jgi:hypothetical protein
VSDTPVSTGGNGDPPPVNDCAGARLDTLSDVRKAIGSLCRLLRAGKVDPSVGGVVMNGYATLAKVMQDQRDSLWTKRAKKLWDEREARIAEPQADH